MDIDANEIAASAAAPAADGVAAASAANMDHTPTGETSTQLAVGGGDQDGIKDLVPVTFEDLRADLAAPYREKNVVLYDRIMQAKDEDELGQAMVSRNVEPVPDHSRLLQEKDEDELGHAMVARNLEPIPGHSGKGTRSAVPVDPEERKKQAEETLKLIDKQYGITDPKTGKHVIANMRNPAHVAELNRVRKEKFEAALKAQTPARELIEKNFLAKFANFSLAVTPDPAAEQLMLEDTRDAKNKQLQKYTVLDIISAPPCVFRTIRFDFRSKPYYNKVKDYLPLSIGVIASIKQVHFPETHRGLVNSYTYPTLVFETAFRCGIYGLDLPRVTTSYGYENFMHALYLHLRTTDVRPTHQKLLESIEEDCRETFTYLNAEASAENLGQAERDKIIGLKRMSAFLAGSVAKAKKAFQSVPSQIVSPYADYFTIPDESGKLWTDVDVPLHSVEEIGSIVQSQGAAYSRKFNVALQQMEQRYKAGSIDAKQFLYEYWILNQGSSVETIRPYEVGVLLSYEQAIDTGDRPDFVVPAAFVNNGGYVNDDVVYKLLIERDMNMRLRWHCIDHIGGETVMEVDGIRFKDSELAKFDMNAVIEPQHAMCPTFQELYDFYRLITMRYPSEEHAVKYMDEMDRVSQLLFNENRLKDTKYVEILTKTMEQATPEVAPAEVPAGGSKERRLNE